ncbi:MAG: hypothetical protein HC853_11125, partial [Anaerolineae bacterium]|nr:hypothetical protein [Anaerolineae bacterium]
MSSTCWDEVVAAYAARDVAQDRIAALNLDALSTAQRMVVFGPRGTPAPPPTRHRAHPDQRA